MLLLLAFVFGLVIGSFLNVCIVRLPEEESVVEPRSHCRSCGHFLAWYDNIPLLSYLALRGRCRSCGASISARYPFVELLTGVLFVLVAAQHPPAKVLALNFAIVSIMVVVTFIDIDHFLILDCITIPSILLAPWIALAVRHVSVVECDLGILVGGGIPWAVAAGYERLRHQEGLGFGDVKFLAMVGGLQGWQAPLFSLMIGAITGSVIGIALMIARRDDMQMEVPFGPFLAFGSVVYLLYGPQLIDLYLSHAPLL